MLRVGLDPRKRSLLKLLKELGSYVLPGGLLFVTAIVLAYVAEDAEWLPTVVRAYPVAVQSLTNRRLKQ